MKKIFSAFMMAVCCLAMAMPAQAQLILNSATLL